MEFDVKQIEATIKRASKIFKNHSYQGRRLGALKSLCDQFKQKSSFSEAQTRYLRNLMTVFSDENLSRAESWSTEWVTNKELRQRGDVISKYYIAQRSWFMEIARDVQSNLTGESENIPDFHMFHKMILNEYADKVWQSHTGKHIWNPGDLVCCRATAKVGGWTYQVRREGVNLNSDPCMVLEVGNHPITNATKYNEKTGGCRWVSINPVGTVHIFQVMEKDLKKYRQPKKKGAKK